MREDIAVIGIGGIFPDALDFSVYWSNILVAKSSIKEIDETLWNLDDFYDSNPSVEDKTYSKVAAQAPSIEFDSLEFGMSPKTLQSTAVEQLYGLVLAKQALTDAGLYGTNAKEYNKERTGVIVSAAVGKTLFSLNHRSEIPKLRKILMNSGAPEALIEDVIKKYKETLLEWDEQSNPGSLSNVVAGRIANRFDLHGTSFCIDAACASSLAAIYAAVSELNNHTCDIMLAGGVNLDLTPATFISFSKTPVLSKSNQVKVFDKNADGIVLGDGGGIIVLRRLRDAEREGDKIYAVIKGMGSSSDGKAKSIYAPSEEGQIKAIQRAVESSGVALEDIGLIEAHGTGTAVGDKCEIQALKKVFGNKAPKIVIGSVKSMIGHLRMAAGVASLIKTILALYHQVLPPTGKIDNLNEAFKDSGLYVLEKPRPWLVNKRNPIRSAGVSAFGFGGANYHIILQEHSGNSNKICFEKKSEKVRKQVFYGNNCEELKEVIEKYIEKLKIESVICCSEFGSDKARYGIVFAVNKVDEAIKKAMRAMDLLEGFFSSNVGCGDILFVDKKKVSNKSVAILFPGQGTQYQEMFRDVTIECEELRSSIQKIDNAMLDRGKLAISEIIYPFNQNCSSKLKETCYTQPALAAMCSGLYTILEKNGVKPDYLIGHSFGEVVATWAAGIIDEDSLYRLSILRGEFMNACSDKNGMLAVFADEESVKKLIDNTKIDIANVNSANQVVLSGKKDELEIIAKKADKSGMRSKFLSVSNAFHSREMVAASKKLSNEINKLDLNKMHTPIICGINGNIYVDDEKAVMNNLSKQLHNTIQFKKSIETAYLNGARIFIEVGPGKVLANLTREILKDYSDYEVLSVDMQSSESGLYVLELLLGHLMVLGLKLKRGHYSNSKKKSETSSRQAITKIDSQYYYLSEKKEKMLRAINDSSNYCYINEKGKELEMSINNKRRSLDTTIEIYKQNADLYKNYMNMQQEKSERILSIVNNHLDKSGVNMQALLEYAYRIQELDAEVLMEFLGRVGKYEENNCNNPVESIVNNYTGENEPKQIRKETSSSSVNASKKEHKDSKELSNNVIKGILSELTGYPEELIDNDMDLERDLGIDSIKKVQLLTMIKEAYPQLIIENSIPNVTIVSDLLSNENFIANTSDKVEQEKIKDILFNAVSDLTGFPVDLIELEMDLETDLGIDSIKLVQLYSELGEKYDINKDQLSKMADKRTLNDIISFLKSE